MLAILKELTAVKGSFDVSGTVSYASQKPWMFSGSIKQNILFGQPWNDERYQKVIFFFSIDLFRGTVVILIK